MMFWKRTNSSRWGVAALRHSSCSSGRIQTNILCSGSEFTPTCTCETQVEREILWKQKVCHTTSGPHLFNVNVRLLTSSRTVMWLFWRQRPTVSCCLSKLRCISSFSYRRHWWIQISSLYEHDHIVWRSSCNSVALKKEIFHRRSEVKSRDSRREQNIVPLTVEISANK